MLPAAVYLGHPGTFPAVDAVNRVGELAGAGGGEDFLAVPDQPEGYGRMGQGLHLYGGSDPGAFHGVGFHKFHAGRGVEEQVPDDDGGAVGTASLGFFRDLPGFQLDANSGNGRGGLGQQINAADGSDGGQCFTAETAGGDGG